MKFNYKFSNLLGSVYHKGNIVFTQDSETLLSPVGNRVTLYDLKRCASQTLSVESKFNITGLALSPNGRLLILINEQGEAMLVSTMKMTVLYKHRFNRAINCVRFSPDGRYFAVTKENLVFVYLTPGKANKMYNPFTLYRVLQGAYDETTTLTWSSDSRVLAVGSKDMSTRIHPLDVETGRRVSVLGGHNAAIVSVFLMHDTLDCYTLSSNGQLCAWTCSHTLEEMKELCRHNKNITQSTEQPELRQQPATDNTVVSTDTTDDDVSGVRYKQRLKRYLLDLVRGTEGGETGGGGRVELTSCDYHHDNCLLVTGYSNGCFLLHEMPDVTLIHSLSVSDERVSAVAVCPRGDWIAVACSGKGQLLVWEWRSETYVLKQQGHVNNMTCLNYSPNGELVATGAHDGKVKLWNCISGFCFVTFSEHRSSITGVQFTQSGRAVVSCSLDGTVRAFDTTRYRNFRTLTSPRPAQFSCLAVDSSGELVAAGAQDLFEIYLWSLQLGKLLEVLSGHQGPVSGIVFSPNPSSSALASTSWDQTLRIWDVISSKVQKETIDLRSEGLSIVYSPDGGELAVACLSGQIQLFDPVWAAQTGCIEGRSDLHSGRADADQIKAKTKLQSKAFTTLCYTADGRCILAAGHSKNVCIYHVQERLLMAKYEITQNRSFDAVDDFINRRKLCEFGNLSLVESRDDDDASIHVRMPGAKHGDMAARAVRPEIRVLSVQFSPTGDVFGAVSTEGLLVYSLSHALVFEPLQLQEDITRDSVLNASAAGDHAQALLSAFHLNQPAVTRRVIERVPYDQISGMVTGMPHRYVERLLVFLSAELDVSAHVQFYSSWVHQLLQTHTGWMRVRVSRLLPQLRQLQRALSVKHNTLGNICSHNRYMLQYLCNLADLQHEAEVKQEALQGAEDGRLQDGSLQDTLSPTPKRTTHSMSGLDMEPAKTRHGISLTPTYY